MMAWAWERRNVAQALLARSGAGSIPASLRISHGRGGDLHTEDEEFAVDAPVSPAGVLRRQAQYQRPDRSDRRRPSGPAGPGRSGMPASRRPVPSGLRSAVADDEQHSHRPHPGSVGVSPCGSRRRLTVTVRTGIADVSVARRRPARPETEFRHRSRKCHRCCSLSECLRSSHVDGVAA